ncbi:helix-turn-helix transcriptional regulator [Salmonella enterica]
MFLMKYILVIDNDLYNRAGIHSYLISKFSNVQILHDITLENIKKSSLIIFSFPLINNLPSFIFLRRYYITKIICIVTNPSSINIKILPTGMNDIILIPKNITLQKFYNIVRNSLNDRDRMTNNNDGVCNFWTQSYFSPQQYNILFRMFNGQTVNDIARELMLSKSTVYSHKYSFMNKFKLKTTYELYLFWMLLNKCISEKCSSALSGAECSSGWVLHLASAAVFTTASGES